jgi:UDP-N-acetylmuramoyl-tripeptide--D-alanyl-D-alanine ligase
VVSVSIKQFVADSGGLFHGDSSLLDLFASAVCTDSRSVQKGDIFVALQGDRYDGHEFVETALREGATIALVNRQWHVEHPSVVPVVVVTDTLLAYQEAARCHRLRHPIPVIAVTGSAGKTTSKEMMYKVLSRRYRVLRNKKSFNNHVGVPATLFELTPDHELLLTELGTNHFGELDRLSYLVEPVVAVIVNIGYAHLEFFGDLDGVRRAKFEIFNHCRPGAVAVYNNDDGWLCGQRYPVSGACGFGYERPADLTAEVMGCDDNGCYRFKVLQEVVQLKVPGRHNISNALAAAAVGMHYNLTPAEIRAGLEAFQAVDKRMQVRTLAGIRIMNDAYNANPGSCRAALDTLADVSAHGRKIAVLGDMLELGPYEVTEHRRLADHVVAARLDALFLFGSRTRDTWQRAEELGMKAVFHFDDKSELARSLFSFLETDDVVLVKGSRGMQMENVITHLEQLSGAL